MSQLCHKYGMATARTCADVDRVCRCWWTRTTKSAGCRRRRGWVWSTWRGRSASHAPKPRAIRWYVARVFVHALCLSVRVRWRHVLCIHHRSLICCSSVCACMVLVCETADACFVHVPLISSVLQQRVRMHGSCLWTLACNNACACRCSSVMLWVNILYVHALPTLACSIVCGLWMQLSKRLTLQMCKVIRIKCELVKVLTHSVNSCAQVEAAAINKSLSALSQVSARYDRCRFAPGVYQRPKSIVFGLHIVSIMFAGDLFHVFAIHKISTTIPCSFVTKHKMSTKKYNAKRPCALPLVKPGIRLINENHIQCKRGVAQWESTV